MDNSKLNISDIDVELDMDGVLADFDGAIDAQPDLFQIRQSIKSLSFNVKSKLNDGNEFHFKDLDSFLKGPQADPDLFRLKRKLKYGKERIFTFASDAGFFSGLAKMQDADELFAGVEKLLNGKKPNILTAPLKSSPTCVYEKKLWVETYYKDRYDKFRADPDKFKYAHSRSVLIDDTPKKVRAYQQAGGLAILHVNAKDTLTELESIFQNKFGKNVSL